ncbi:hypothetical protein L1987_42771 [Smallanthus sonchifolius]|uniref:Uncharacterized protein n=1 Tax=Smallanthus sonchifolius TaxID=185202 RepID=A0ACB9GKR3_9ASTR|nr:hypothetical protein L1987_42771 [Smallanthus sonchifolius]
MMMLFHLQHHLHHHDHDTGHADDHDVRWKVFPNIYHLPTLPFHDVAASKVVDDICSICLFEFGDEDVVSQLDACHHVFHKCCIMRCLDHGHFTCPLCRSSLLNVLCKHVE